MYYCVYLVPSGRYDRVYLFVMIISIVREPVLVRQANPVPGARVDISCAKTKLSRFSTGSPTS